LPKGIGRLVCQLYSLTEEKMFSGSINDTTPYPLLMQSCMVCGGQPRKNPGAPLGAWPQRIVMLQTDEGRAELAKLYGIDAFLEACEADAASLDGGLANDGT